MTLRAAVLVGEGSTSFEIVRQISERMPVESLPTWVDSLVQPVAVTDVLEARLTYAELLRTYARVAGIERRQVSVPGLPSELVGSWPGLVTDVPSSTVKALVESLTTT